MQQSGFNPMGLVAVALVIVIVLGVGIFLYGPQAYQRSKCGVDSCVTRSSLIPDASTISATSSTFSIVVKNPTNSSITGWFEVAYCAESPQTTLNPRCNFTSVTTFTIGTGTQIETAYFNPALPHGTYQFQWDVEQTYPKVTLAGNNGFINATV